MGVDRTVAFVEHMTWDRVEKRINEGAVAILPIGAAAKQHGLHLPLDTDRIQAEWFAERLAQRFSALIWPTITYGHYPAFTEYAGSVSLSAPLFEATVREIATGILAQGCRALFVLDTGLSTIAPVGRALDGLDCARHLRIHDGPNYLDATRRLVEQDHGSHADELETSLMLALAPDLVDMARAEASLAARHAAPGPLTPSDTTSANYSRSGSYGDPTLATREKGEIMLAAIIDDVSEQVAALLVAIAGETRNPAPSVS
jgi:creatinine amidohydrolase